MLTAYQMKMTGAGYQSDSESQQEKTGEEGEEVEEESPAKSSGPLVARDELLNRTYKFLGVINTTFQQLQIQGLLY